MGFGGISTIQLVAFYLIWLLVTGPILVYLARRKVLWPRMTIGIGIVILVILPPIGLILLFFLSLLKDRSELAESQDVRTE
jgi:hypothetical protein